MHGHRSRSFKHGTLDRYFTHEANHCASRLMLHHHPKKVRIPVNSYRPLRRLYLSLPACQAPTHNPWTKKKWHKSRLILLHLLGAFPALHFLLRRQPSQTKRPLDYHVVPRPFHPRRMGFLWRCFGGVPAILSSSGWLSWEKMGRCDEVV